MPPDVDRAHATLRDLLTAVPEVIDHRRSRLDPYVEAHAAVLNALEDFPTILAISDNDNRLVRLNAAACAFLGRPEQEMIGHGVFEYLEPEFQAEMRNALATEAAGTSTAYENHEWAFERPDASLVWGAIRTKRLLDPDGRIWSRMSMVEDITARKLGAAQEAILRAGLLHYQTVFQRGAVAQLVIDFRSYRILLVNTAFCTLMGCDEADLVGSDGRLIYPADQDPSPDAHRRLATSGTTTYSVARTLQRLDGTTLPVLATVGGVLDDNGVVIQLVVQVQDMTSQLAADQRERSSKALLKAALGALPVTFTTFDTDLRFTSVIGGLDGPGTRPEAYVGKHVTDVITEAATLRAMEVALAGDESSTRLTFNGETHLTLFGPICDDDARVVGVAAVSTNISAEVAAENDRRTAEELRLFLAEHDPLTGLPARSALLERLDSLGRSGDGAGALLLLDVDDFELINEALGHGVGDAVLMEVASRLAEAFPGLMVARHGGDEFAVVSPFDVSREEAVDACERALTALEPAIEVGEHVLRVTASIGVAEGEPSGASSLLQNADAALSRAKSAGTGQYRVYDAEMRCQVRRRLQVQSGLRIALSSGQLHVAYQPIVTIADRRIIGSEALLRWTHPEWGVVPPKEFIPVAERSGLITAIGKWVVQAACSDALALQRGYGAYVAVNASVGELVGGRFADWIEEVLATTGLPAEALVIEVTESALMDDIAPIRTAFARLRERGIRVSIDDFGTGYSSLARLQHLPVDVIKLDREFVTAIDTRSEARHGGDHPAAEQGHRRQHRGRGHRDGGRGGHPARPGLHRGPGVPVRTSHVDRRPRGAHAFAAASRGGPDPPAAPFASGRGGLSVSQARGTMRAPRCPRPPCCAPRAGRPRSRPAGAW
ncbi:MAG: EAL domain-containing protein [Candidatus Dormibacteraeota bacterium]|nr:EAL domain-containing protein [Candidatus Dormibacteraeota bacterium]